MADIVLRINSFINRVLRFFHKPLGWVAAITLAYLALALAIYYPIVTRYGTFYLGSAYDGALQLWGFWWMKYSLQDLGQSMMSTKYVFFPDGVSLVFNTMPKTLGILSIPLQNVISLAAAFNTAVMATFVGTGLATCWLTYSISGKRLPAFMAGVFFAFSPYRLGQISHLYLLTTVLIPIYILILIKGRRELEAGRWQAWIKFVLAGLVLALIAYDTEHYAIYLVIFTVLFLFYFFPWRRDKGSLGKWMRLAGALFVTGLAAAAAFITAFINAGAAFSEMGDIVTAGPEEMVKYSADLMSFFIPGSASVYLGGLYTFHTEASYLSWVVLVLAIVGFWSYRRRKETGLFAIAAVLFALLALGPWVVVLGEKTPIPGPLALLDYIPLLNSTRTPVRFVVISALAVSVLAGFGLEALFQRLRRYGMGTALVPLAALAVLLLFFLEVRPEPTLTDLTAPEVYKEIAASPIDGSVVILPLGWEAPPAGGVGMQRGYPEIYQPVHLRPMVGGYVSRAPTEKVLKYNDEPVLDYLSNPVEKKPAPSDQVPENTSRILSTYQIAFIVVQKHGPLEYVDGEIRSFPDFDEETLEQVDLYITRQLGMERFEENDDIVAYRRKS